MDLAVYFRLGLRGPSSSVIFKLRLGTDLPSNGFLLGSPIRKLVKLSCSV